MKKLLATLLFVPAMAHAEFFTGNDILSKMQGDIYDRIQSLGYVQGVYDVYVHVTFCPPGGGTQVTAGQIRDMIFNYLNNNPAIRHKTAESIINDALKQVWPCASRGRGA